MKYIPLVLVIFIASASSGSTSTNPQACRVSNDGLPSTQKLEDPVSQACLEVATVKLENCTAPKGGQEEAKARAAASAERLSGSDVLARLIFSESLSTGYWNQKCKSPSADALMKSIAWGIISRVPKAQQSNPTAYPDQVFKPGQFRTSFSGVKSKPNPFANAFLCPLQETVSQPAAASTLFRQAQSIANQVAQEVRQTGIPSQYQGVTNFFYPQSEFFGTKRPSWAPNPDPTKNRGYMPVLGSVNPCVEFYNLH